MNGLKQNLLSSLSLDISQLLKMYDLLPDVLFWVKNTDGEVVHANQGFLEHIGVRNLDQVLGLTDFDFAPRHIARQFVADDKRVLNGELVTDRLEMNVAESGEVAWFITSKRPLLNHARDIVGSFGITRHLEKTSITFSGLEALRAPITLIRDNYMRHISLKELADTSHLSISALERRFKKYLAKTPKQYINDVRLENARRLLVETQMPIASVADQTGFTDASYFSRRFNRKFGVLPSLFRLEYQL
jgi:AraC-like DNA-binding protein